MARHRREFSSTGIYHIVLKGHNNSPVFKTRAAVKRFLEILKDLKKEFNFEVYAYCFMKNHVHLLLKESEPKSISTFMKCLKLRFTFWYQLNYRCTGCVFQGRFKSRAVDNVNYLKNVVRYIHRNPVKAGICKQPGDYRDSSYLCFFGDNSGIIDRDFVFEQLNPLYFAEFHTDNRADDIDTELGVCVIAPDRKAEAIPDEEATRLMQRISNCRNGLAFLRLDRRKRWQFIKRFRELHCSCRQIASFITRSKGAVHYWSSLSNA